jgi:hypothetical protein
LSDAAKKPVLPYAVASACACAIGIVLALVFRKPIALYAALAASAGALCGLSGLAAFANRGLNGVMLGFTVGFLARGVLVAVGLLASGARGNDALTYVFTFFALYLATQIVEVLFVARGAQGATP